MTVDGLQVLASVLCSPPRVEVSAWLYSLVYSLSLCDLFISHYYRKFTTGVLIALKSLGAGGRNNLFAS